MAQSADWRLATRLLSGGAGRPHAGFLSINTGETMKKYLSLTTALAAMLPLAPPAQTGVPSAPTPPKPPQQPIPPAPPTVPAPPAPPARHPHRMDHEAKEPVTYLGVETSEVPRVLSAQMGLQRGFGVVV